MQDLFAAIYIDEYWPATAELEIVTGEIIKAIKGNPRLHNLYFTNLANCLSVEEKLTCAREFRRNLEQHRHWSDKNLWWM